MPQSIGLEEMNTSFSPFFGEYIPTPAGPSGATLLQELPEASKSYRGRFVVVPQGDTDKLYTCLRVNGTYTWMPLSGNTSSNVDATEAILGVATLGIMKLG